VIPVPPITIIDDGDTGFVATSGFNNFTGGYQGDFRYADKGFGNQTAAWNFTSLANGEYKVWTTWKPAGSRPSNAPYTISDDQGVLATVPLDQRVEPDDLTADGGTWEELGTYDVLGNELHVVLSDDADQRWVIADAVRIERLGDVVVAPEIDIVWGPNQTSISDAGTAALGQTSVGTAVDHVFTVKNTGNTDLTLTAIDDAAFPSGITLAANIGSTTLERGQSTTFTLRVTATAEADISGALVLENNDGDEDPYNINFTAKVIPVPPITIIDDGDTGFVATNGFNSFSGGYQNDFRYAADGNGNQTAAWNFTSLANGEYQVWTTWKQNNTRATNAPYTISDDQNALATVRLDQTSSPNDLTADGGNWEELGTYDVLGNELHVVLSDDVDQRWVIADAVRIERIGDVVVAPEIDVAWGPNQTSISDAGTAALGETSVGTAVDHVFTVKNTGNTDLTLTAIDDAAFPSGITLAANIGSTTLERGQSTTFTLRVTATAEADISGALALASNDSDENPYNINFTANVVPVPPITIIDDGDSGFVATNGFNSFTGGYQNDFRYAANGFGNQTAAWNFTSLANGEYKVWTTWKAANTRPTDAPYTISDDQGVLATVRLDQRVAPNDLTADGGNWEELGTYDVLGNELHVVLSDDADHRWVIADAVRIERLGDVVVAPEIDVVWGPNQTSISDAGTAALGETSVGTAVDHVFTVKNTGNTDLTLTAIDDAAFPSGITLAANIGSTTVERGQSTTFTLRVTATAEADISGALVLENNDGDEDPYNINFTAQVVPVPPVTIIDDGDSGFVATNGFANWVGGYQGDFRYSDKGFGNQTAAWNFTSLPDGSYQVWTTWKAANTRPSNAPYTISDHQGALATVRLDQRVAPDDLTADGGTWEELGTYNVLGGELHVVLSDDADHRWVVADAVRIERLGDAT
jgi:hypothetical protein